MIERHLIEEPVDHLSSILGLMRGWLGVFRGILMILVR